MRQRLVTVLLAVVAGVLAAPAAFAQDGESVQGTLRGPDGKPVQGVVIVVTSEGKRIGQDTSQASGSWEVQLPRAGSYDVELDVATLPAGLVPRSKDSATLDAVPVRPGDHRTVLFPLVPPGEAEGQGAGPQGGQRDADGGGAGQVLGRVPQLLVEGVKFGVIIAITAIGLSLIFGTTGLINFAHGELVTIGATAAFFLNVAAAGPGLQLIPAALIAVVIGAMVGGGMERGLWRPLRLRGVGRIQLFIISIGLSLLLRHLILVFFGSRPQPYADYTIQQALTFGPISITPRDLIIIGLSLAVLVGVGLMLQLTRIGKAMRAVSDNRDLAESSGINVDRVVLVVWLLGGGLAGLGGVFFGLAEIVTWDMGFNLLLLMFAGVILGGLGTAYGAMVGSLLVGMVAQLSTLYFPVELQYAWALLALIIVLLVRPQGILGRPERIG
ncbi:MAG: branched-chain amino acid ABC transporter permease [Carbonactinosporaceae bacterium]